MDLHAILIRAPVNRLAASVTSQRRVAKEDAPLTIPELVYLLQRLERKRKLLQRVLGIKSRRQSKNVKDRFKRGKSQFRQAKEPRAFAEYLLLGQQQAMLNHALCAAHKETK